MDLRNCKSCGKIFKYYGGQPCCPACMERLDAVFKQVKEYIYDNPQTGIQEIADKFEVGVPIIHNWIREERLSFAKNSTVGIPCEACGVSIITGRYCEKCKRQLIQGLSGVYHRTEAHDSERDLKGKSPKMHFLSSTKE